MVIRWGKIWTVFWVGVSSNFNFKIVSMVAAAVQGQALSRCKTIPFVSIPLHLLQIVGFNSSSSIAEYCVLLIVYNPGSAQGCAH
jgi:hypothetical protein